MYNRLININIYIFFILLLVSIQTSVAQELTAEEAQKSRESLQFYVKVLSPVIFTVLLVVLLWIFNRKRKQSER